METNQKLQDEQLKVIKQWFFKESITLENRKLELEEEIKKFENEKKEFERIMDAKESMYEVMRKQLLREKTTFEQQFNVLTLELRKLAAEKEQLKKEKENLERLKNKFSFIGDLNKINPVSVFFKGLCDQKSIKQRYKDLTKIFHPDNMDGDDELMKMINLEYDNIRRD